MRASNPFRGAARRQTGFTLVELLVGVALGMLVMVALVGVYLNVSRTNTEMSKTNSVIENGRFAVDVLTDDLAHAGFWGGFTPDFDNFAFEKIPTDIPGTATVELGPCLAYDSWDNAYKAMLVGVPVMAYAGVPTGCSAVVTDRKAGTDVLVVRHAETCRPGETNCEAFDAQKVYFQPTFCADEDDARRDASELPYLLTASTTAAGTTTFALKGRKCLTTALAPYRKFISHIYYIRTWANTSGDGIPTLVRASFNRNGSTPQHETNATALIEGIEHMVVMLGVDGSGRCAGSVNDYSTKLNNESNANDSTSGGFMVDPATCTYNAVTSKNTMPSTRGDGVPESYVHCGASGCTATQLQDVVAAKLYLLARSREQSSGHTDDRTYTLGSVTVTPSGDEQKYKRSVFQTTIRLNNVSARRETP